MSLLFIHTQNSRFHARDDGADYDQPEMALAMGVRGAVALIADEVNQGQTSAAIEVSIERADGTQLFRSVVAVSVSPLIVQPPRGDPGETSVHRGPGWG